MSWGGRWQKGLSHQACVASDSEQGEDQTAQGSSLPLQLSASRASGASRAWPYRKRPLLPFAPLAPSPAGNCLGPGRQPVGLFTGSDPGGGPSPGFRPLGLEVGPKLSCVLSRSLLMLEVLPVPRERSEGIVGLLGSGLRRELPRNVATWARGPPQLFQLLVPSIRCPRLRGFPFPVVGVGRRVWVPRLCISQVGKGGLLEAPRPYPPPPAKQ